MMNALRKVNCCRDICSVIFYRIANDMNGEFEVINLSPDPKGAQLSLKLPNEWREFHKEEEEEKDIEGEEHTIKYNHYLLGMGNIDNFVYDYCNHDYCFH